MNYQKEWEAYYLSKNVNDLKPNYDSFAAGVETGKDFIIKTMSISEAEIRQKLTVVEEKVDYLERTISDLQDKILKLGGHRRLVIK